MIRLEGVTFHYPGQESPTLQRVDLAIGEGELCLVTGATGSGKSTLLATVNGLVPRFTGGTLTGRVEVGGRATSDHSVADLAGIVGYVAQDPVRGFVAERVEEELAWGMEQLGVAPEVMRVRVEEVLDLLGIADLRDVPVTELSGGQQQRVAIGAVLAMHPQVLVLDEPTSALDPGAAEEVLSAVTRLVHDLGLTVLMAEHRLERVVQYADRVAHVGPGGTVVHGPAQEVMATSSVVPPVVELGRAAGWSPLPLSVRDARRHAPDLRRRLDGPPPTAAPSRLPGVAVRGLTVRYGEVTAVRDLDIDVAAGEVTAVMGRNGSGKSSLFWAIHGSGNATGDVASPRPVALVPQTPGDLLFAASVDAECEHADAAGSRPPGTCRRLLDLLAPGIGGATHPSDLSEGQRLALVLAIQLTPDPPVVVLDEPTRGLDYTAKRALAARARQLAAQGKVVLLSTHDVEFAALIADRVVVMAQGEVVADGRAAVVLPGSPLFSPQVTRILAPDRWLTVDAVVSALGRTA